MPAFRQFLNASTESGQHPMQYRLAFAIAGRINCQVMANFLLRTFAPPEHRHLQRLVTMQVSILQQFRFAALATSGRRHHLQGSYSARCKGGLRIIPEGCIPENLQQVLRLAFMILHAGTARTAIAARHQIMSCAVASGEEYPPERLHIPFPG